jgi:spore coat protein A
MRLTRRAFVKYAGGTALTLYLVGPEGERVAVAAIPGGTLDPADIARFAQPLLVPPVMPRAGRLRQGGRPIDYYEISVRQFAQQVLPPGMPQTTVWGYGPVAVESAHNAPSYTIEARWSTPVRVKWVNDLVDNAGHYLPHLLPVDPTLHWANPERLPDADGHAITDTRPALTGLTYVPVGEFTDPTTQYTTYTGPVPLVTHVHGAVGVGDESDGYAEGWYLPAASNLPPGVATTGTWWPFFAGKANQRYGVTWGPGFVVAQYPNVNRASALWYHDHTLGMTRLNVYAGPAGFYLMRGGPAGDGKVIDSRTGGPAVFPGPAPKPNDPPGMTYREIPIAIQDRSFNADGSLFYPDSRTFFDGFEGPYLPESDVPPVWQPEFFGNTLIVNGRVWPFQYVEQRRYRFRVLNGCQSRFLILDFRSIPGVRVWQLANEGGFLPGPLDLTATNHNRLLMGPAERADLIVDFTAVPVGSHVLRNVGPDEPFGGGEPDEEFEQADPDSTGQVLQFRVRPAATTDPSTPPEYLLPPARQPLGPASLTRRVALLEQASALFDGPVAAMVGTVQGDPALGPAVATAYPWMDPVTENPAVGSTEIWEIYNATADAHPIHVHELTFEVRDRQRIDVTPPEEGGEAATQALPTALVQIPPDSLPRPPEAWEAGVKDTVVAYPGEVTRLKATFRTAGQYVWHCHIVEHEDNEMMRPLRVGLRQPGQPE